jgi:glycosyltransferase involved in cell wall biosynthesis
MKVLFISDFGLRSYREFIYNALNESEYIDDFLVVHSGLKYHGNFESLHSLRLPFIGNYKTIGMHIGVLKHIYKYDVIISSFNLRILSCWLPSLIFRKKKWIFWGKGLGDSESILVKNTRKLLANRADRILVYNEVKKNELINTLKIDKSKVISVNNTIKISNAGYDERSNGKYLLYFGRIQERKGLIELIDSYHKYIEQCEWDHFPHLRLVGDGIFKKKIKERVNDLELNKYVDFFEGVYDDVSIKNHFKNAIAYISPFNIGLAVVNSFAYGVPVITTKIEQAGPEYYYLNDKNSIICKGIDDLAVAMVKITNSDKIYKYKKDCFEFYKTNLDYRIMLSNIKKAINDIDTS